MLLLVCSFNLVNCNNSVCADRKQPCVVKVQSNTLDCLAVGLNIKNLLEFDAALVFLFFWRYFECMSKYLDLTWLGLICHTSKQKLSLSTPNNLTILSALSVLESVFSNGYSIIAWLFSSGSYLFNESVVSSRVNYGFYIPFVSKNCNWTECIIFLFIFPDWQSLFRFQGGKPCLISRFIWVKFPKEDTCIPTTSNKPSVIF